MIDADSTHLWMHFWAIATAATVSAGCALVGSFLVVRRLSLLGDAISHAVLPGIVLAVLAGGRPGGAGVFLGAVVAGLVVAAICFARSRRLGVEELKAAAEAAQASSPQEPALS